MIPFEQPPAPLQDAARDHTSRQIWLILILAALAALAILPLTLLQGGFEPLPLALVIAAAGTLVLLLRPTWSLFVLLLIWSVYPTVIQYFDLQNNTLVKLYPEAILAVAFCGLLLRWGVQRQRLVLHLRAPDLAVALLLLGAFVSALMADSVEAIVYGFRLTYLPMLFYILARLLPLTPADVRRWVWLFIGVAAVLSAIAILFELTGPARWYGPLVPPETVTGLWRKGEWRFSSLLLNPLYFGPVVAIAALISFSFLLTTRRWFWLALLVLFSVCTYYSLTRGSYIMLALGVATILALRARRSYPVLIMTLVLTFVALAAVSAILLAGGDFGFLRDTRGDLLSSRYPEFRESIQAFFHNPLGFGLGVGHAQRRIGNAATVALQVYDGWYFKVLLEGGLLALLIFGAFLATVIVYLLRKVVASQSQYAFTLHLAVLAIFIGGVVQAFVTNLWEHHMVNGVLWVLIALCTTLNVDGSTTPMVHGDESLPIQALREEPA